MNRVLVKNWNETVGEDDTVYFLGDMSFGRGSRPASYWVKRLNGRIIYVKGSHDIGVRAPGNLEVEVNGEAFDMTHDPYLYPHPYGRWVIHGHKHQHRPFVDRRARRVNVSVEVTGYKPVSLADIVRSTRNA